MTATFPLNNNKMKLVFSVKLVGGFGWFYGTQLATHCSLECSKDINYMCIAIYGNWFKYDMLEVQTHATAS